MSKKDKNTSIVRSASSLYIGPQSETLSDQSERRIDLHIKSALRFPTAPQCSTFADDMLICIYRMKQLSDIRQPGECFEL